MKVNYALQRPWPSGVRQHPANLINLIMLIILTNPHLSPVSVPRKRLDLDLPGSCADSVFWL
jgi:hypothetical protein